MESAIIIGAGPAGLTAAYELLQHSDIKPVVYEESGEIGGISRTVDHHGNWIDIGGHRFFSKSDRVMDWWRDMLPLQGAPSRDDILLKRDVPLSAEPGAPDPETSDRVMLIRKRLSRILFLRKFFSYPVSPSVKTLVDLGPVRAVKIGVSYVAARVFPIRHERSLEDFFINRFGRQLYLTFFKDYTEKVWGVSCRDIPAEWGAQRIKGLSIGKALWHALKSAGGRGGSIEQKGTETSLIEQFMYPKFGPGQLWCEVARRIRERGGEIHLRHRVEALDLADGKATQVGVRNLETDELLSCSADYFLSSMPVKDLVAGMGDAVPEAVARVARGLPYRDFLTVGLLLRRLLIHNETALPTLNGLVPDSWIYIQERDVKLGRLQIFNNWSPYLVKDPDTVWLGLEYFCSEGDDLWSRPDGAMTELAIEELSRIGVIAEEDVLDSVVIHTTKAYPAYFGSYSEFDRIRAFTDAIPNLFLVGRNGMHRYNNADHSMLTAMVAVENIVNKSTSKANIWSVNTEADYHEEAGAQEGGGAQPDRKGTQR